MVKKSLYHPKNFITQFLDKKLPLPRLFYEQIILFRVPRNLGYLYTFGSILTVLLFFQILTGIVVALHYIPAISMAFDSREYFVRNSPFGWLFGSWHATGASFFFIATYIHLARGLYYGSYKAPREMVWIIGVFIYITMLATAFVGYVLVWGSMSFSAATVITGLFKDIPLIGDLLYKSIVGDHIIGQQLLSRFYVLHYLFPFVLIFLVILHIWAIHVVGSGNPTGIEVQSEKETVCFVPYMLIKDIFAFGVFLLFFAWFLFFMPDYMISADNFTPATTFKTPIYIIPEWYFLPFYAMLKSVSFNCGPISSTFGGFLVLFASIFVLFFIPWLDRSPVRSARYRPLYRLFYWFFIGDVFFLGWLGAQPINEEVINKTQWATFSYFTFFLVIMPVFSRIEKNL